MTELDFITFGIKTDNSQLLNRIHEALSVIYSFGNLQLRAAWLYYGSIPKAAKAFNVSVYDFQNLIQPKERFPVDIMSMVQDRGQWMKSSKIISKFARPSLNSLTKADFVVAHYDEWNLFQIGAEMILEMPDDARTKLFSLASLPMNQNDLIHKINTWQETQNNRIAIKSKALIERYLLMWSFRNHSRKFFECAAISIALRRAFEYKDEIRNFANSSKLCAVASDIFNEYETYSEQWLETRKYIKKQRNIASSKRNTFFAEVGIRDGLKCSFCRATENLKLDHIKAVSQGGLSVIDNFQLLCFNCNAKKGKEERAIIHG